jgi:hypothetical protein
MARVSCSCTCSRLLAVSLNLKEDSRFRVFPVHENTIAEWERVASFGAALFV